MDFIYHLRKAGRMYASFPLQFLSISLVLIPLQAVGWLGNGPWYWLTLIPSLLLPEFVFGALVYAAATAAEGTRPDVRSSYGAVLSRLGNVIGVTVRYFGAIVLLSITIVGIPFAVRLFVRWLFGIHGVVLRDLSAGAALHLSSRLVIGKSWQVFGALVFGGLLVSTVWWVPLLLSWSFELRMVTSLVVGVGGAPFWACFYTLWFLQLCEQEDVSRDAEVLAR